MCIRDRLEINVPRATPKTFKSYVKTSRELKMIFKLDRTIIKKLEILVFCIPR